MPYRTMELQEVEIKQSEESRFYQEVIKSFNPNYIWKCKCEKISMFKRWYYLIDNDFITGKGLMIKAKSNGQIYIVKLGKANKIKISKCIRKLLSKLIKDAIREKKIKDLEEEREEKRAVLLKITESLTKEE